MYGMSETTSGGLEFGTSSRRSKSMKQNRKTFDVKPTIKIALEVIRTLWPIALWFWKR
jgi:hypothetical protein